MKASVRSAYGPPSVLRIETIEKPTPKAQELLVKVHATTVNRTDCGALWGKPFIFRFFVGFPTPRFVSTGTDFAGTVEAIGTAVTRFKVGDRVFGFNDNCLGSHAEFFTISENQPIMTIPAAVSFEDAAASLEGAHYAYNFITKVTLKEGSQVLLNGVTGAIGSAALQILRKYKLRITAVCGPAHLAWAKSMGAEKTYDYTCEDFTTKNEKYALIFDAVGKSSYSRCKHLLEKDGVYISSELGDRAENLFWAAVTPFLGGRKVIFPIPVDIKRTLELVRDLLEKGEFKPLIDKSYPLDSLAEAFEYVASGAKLGNVMVKFQAILLAFLFGCAGLHADERRVITNHAPVHAEPSRQSEVIGHLPKGKRTWVTDQSGDFAKLRSRSRRSLWLLKKDLEALPDSEPYEVSTDVDAPFALGVSDFKRIRLDLGGSAGRVQNESFLEVAAGVEYFMMERLSWRNSVFYRRYQVAPDFIGLDTSVRGNGNLPLGPLRLRGIIGVGYRFATAQEGAPFAEVGGFAELKGFDVGLMLKVLNRSIFDSSRENVVLYSVVLSGGTGFF